MTDKKPVKPVKPQAKKQVLVDLSQQVNKEKYRSFDAIARDLKKQNIKPLKIIICIDFTNSNEFSGNKMYKACMHGPVSPYKKILQKLKTVLPQLPISELYGFKFGDEETNDKLVAPLSGDGLYKSIDELANAYTEACKTIKLGGPTSLEPLMKKAIDISQSKFYTFLLILTDGDISEIQRDKDALLNCSQYPISVSAVGVGDGPFDVMENFDDMKGRKFDNFSFDAFTDEVEDVGVLAFQEMVEQYKDMVTIGLITQ